MKSKIKIISLLVLISIICTSLSSCLFFEAVTGVTGSDKGGPDATINTGDIHNYEIDIAPSAEQNVIATSKALMSAVSIVTDVARGSGVIFKLSDDKSEAYILTNYHVIYGAKGGIKVYLYGQESYLFGSEDTMSYAIDAYYLGGSVAYDLAVLKVKNDPVLMASNAVACTFADSNDIAVLETAIAVGNATGNGISATVGRVNVDSEYISLYAADEKTLINLRVMRTDAAVNEGNSGGGLFNSRGELIGIVNAKSIDSKVDNIGFAIPSNVARYIAENIIYYCDGESTLSSAYKCMLGITVQIAGLYTEYDEESGILHRKELVEVLDVNRGAAADGILKSGDIVNSITIDGKKFEVTRRFHVVDAMLNARASSDVTVNVTRGEEKLDLKITLSNKDIVNADG